MHNYEQPGMPAAVREFISSFRYKIELHAHTSPASSCSELAPKRLIEMAKEKNYDEVVITNHFHAKGTFVDAPDPVGKYLEDFRIAKEEGERLGVKVLLGAEYRFTENNNDYLVFGVDEKFLRDTVGEFSLTYGQFYEKYHCDELLIIQAHPYRTGLAAVDPAHEDGLETFNMHPNHNSRVAVAQIWAREQGIPIMTVGTDLHHEEHQGLCSLRARTLPGNERELVELLRSRDYLFEVGGCPVLPYAQF